MLRDIAVYTVKAVTIVEIMGRDAGWLTTASALAGASDGIGPDLIYLPEHPFSTEEFLADIRRIQSTQPAVLVAVSEGIRFADGEYVGAGTQSGAVDVFGHKYLAGTGKVLEGLVKDRLGCKVRSIELSLPQRCAGHILSAADISESLKVGAAAVNAAIAGESGVMMIFVREAGDEYSVKVESYDISKIANAIRTVPDEYINEAGNGITEAGLAYLAPLISGEVACEYDNGMPRHIVL
jgi:6-phosphofructokinase 1